MTSEANPFESLQEQIDDASAYLDVRSDLVHSQQVAVRVVSEQQVGRPC